MSKKTPWSAAQLRELEQELHRERGRLARAAEGGDAVAAVRVQVLDDALQRMAHGGYGICTACEQPIPFGRLAVVPETDHCLACQSGAPRRRRTPPAA
ncbi:MAG TPA: TraR/DksA C4-type zinc finger protein [Gemmatimonadaceae bacterium]